MTQQHPITPPPELVEQWMQVDTAKYDLARQAAQWGADQELEACCEWFASDVVSEVIDVVSDLRAARSPKPPSLKKQALVVLDDIPSIDGAHYNTIRRALEQLDD
jgi:hypothetical protein